MSMHEKPTETPMTQAEILAQVVHNPESILDPVDDDLTKLHERLAASRTPEVSEAAPDVAPTSEGVAGAVVHSRGGTAEQNSDAVLREVFQKKLMEAKGMKVSGGEHLTVDTVMASDITVSAGARLTVKGKIMDSIVRVEPGGTYECLGTSFKVERVDIVPNDDPSGGTEAIDAQKAKGRRGKGRAKSGSISVPVPPSAQGVPLVEKPVTPEKEPIQTGKYLDSAALLCEVYEQGGDFSYKVLEGEDEGQIIPVGDESRMRALMGDEWKKVDDATVPNLIDSAEPVKAAEAGLEQQEQHESDKLEEGQMWIKEIEVDGKKGREFILIEKISGNTIEISRERQGVGFFENGKSESFDAVALTRVLQEEGFELEKGLVSVVSASAEKPDKVRTEKGVDGSETGHFYPLANIGDTAVYDSADGKVTVLRTPKGYLVKSPGTNDTETDERGVAHFAEVWGWTRESQTTSFSVDVNPAEKIDVDTELPLGEGEATPEQFLQNLPEGGSIKMKSKRGRLKREYVKLGDGFVGADGEVTTQYILELIHKNGWTIEPLAAEPVAPETEIEKSPEQEEKQASRFVHMEKVGEQAFYVRQSDGFFDDSGVQTVKVTRAQKKRGGVMVEGYLIKDSARGGEDEKGVLKNIRKKAERLGAFHIDFDITGEGFVTLDQIDAVAQAEGWVPMESAESLSLGEAPTPPKFFENESKDESKSELDELRAKVQEERFAYVEIDYQQNSAWSKIKNILRLGEEREDVDTQAALQRYKNALMQLQEAELEQVKKSNLKGEALKERLSGILMYVKYNEEVELMRSRNEVRIQKRNKWEKTVAKFEEVGRWYNGLSRGKKLAVAAACGGIALAGGAATGGSAALVSGVLFARRAVATAGLAVTFDTLAEGIFDKRRSSKMKDAAEESIEEYALNAAGMGLDGKDSNGKDRGGENTDDYFLTLVRNNIQLQTEDLENRFKNRKREALLRRSGAWAAAATATLGYSAYQSWFGGESTPGAPRVQGPDSSQEGDLDQAVRDLREQTGTPVPAENAASAPEQAAAAASAPEAAASTAGQGASAIPTPEPAPAVAEAVPGKVGTLLEKYDVTSADGKKGLWGIFEQRLPAGFEGDKNKAIQSLNNLVQQKVNGMTPDQLKEIGFRTSDISKIYPGDKLDFSKLLSQAEIQSVLDGKSVAAPSVASVVDTVSTEKITNTAARVMDVNSTEYAKAIEIEHERMIAQDRLAHGYTPAEQAALNAAEDQMIADSKAAELTPNAVRTAAAETIKAPSNPFELKSLKVFLQENPDRIPEFKNTLGGIRQVMFNTPDVGMMNPSRAVYFDYRVQPMMGRVDMLRVLEYSRDLRTGALQEYAFNQFGGPIHTSQIRQLANLVQVAQDSKLFGTFGQVMRGENIDEYTRRIAALATATNKAPQLAMMLTGRAQRII